MKKILVLLLATVLLLGTLAGCGKQDEQTDNITETGKNAANQQTTPENGETGAPTEPRPEQVFGVAAGTELDAPECVFDASTLEMLYISFIRLEDGKQVATEISIAKAEDGAELIYAVNGPGKNKEALYEVTENGIIKYIKGSSKDPFKHDEKTDKEAVLVEEAILNSYLRIFTQYLDTFAGLTYRKAVDVTINCPTGDVYIYDVISNGKVVGQVCVDKETGMLVKAKDLSDGKAGEQFIIDTTTGALLKEEKDSASGTYLSVQSFKTTGVQIPAFDKYVPGEEEEEEEEEDIVDSTIKVGDTVRLKENAKTYKGGSLAFFVFNRNHKVIEIIGDRAVIVYGNTVVAAVKVSDLVPAK